MDEEIIRILIEAKESLRNALNIVNSMDQEAYRFNREQFEDVTKLTVECQNIGGIISHRLKHVRP